MYIFFLRIYILFIIILWFCDLRNLRNLLILLLSKHLKCKQTENIKKQTVLFKWKVNKFFQIKVHQVFESW